MSLNNSQIIGDSVEKTSAILFVCPADPIHALNTYERYKKHVNRCKALKNKKVYFCRFFWAHQYLNQQHKNDHEIICEYNLNPGQELEGTINDFFIIKGDESVNDDRNMIGKYKTDQIDWWEKHKHEVLAYKRKKAILRRRVEKEKIEMDRPKKELEDLQYELLKKLDEIKNSTNTEDYNFNFKGPDFERFQMILLTKGLFKFKSNWFDFEEYANIDHFSDFFNENISEDVFKIYLGGEFFLTENSAFAEKNLDILLKNLSEKSIVGVNYSKGLEENTQEVLIVISKETDYFGKYLSKLCHLGVIVLPRKSFKNMALQNKDIFKEESCWLYLEDEKNNKNNGNNSIIDNNIYIEKYGNNNDENNQIYYEKIMKKYILKHEKKNQEKILKEKENSYDKFIAEKKEDVKSLINQIKELNKRKENLIKDFNDLTNSIKLVKFEKDDFVKKNKEIYREKIEIEKKNLNLKYNEIKRKHDNENIEILNLFRENEFNMKELQEEHQKIDEKLEDLVKKNKIITEEINEKIELNKKLEENVNKIENEFDEKNFFDKIIEMSTKSNKETVCLICSQRRREIVNIPCKHITLCSDCCYKITVPLNFKICLICQEFVERTVKANFEKL